MVFSSLHFIFIFLPIVLIGNQLIKKIEKKNYWLLLCSLIFYAWGEPKFVIVMIASIMMNYFLGLAIESHHKKSTLVAAIVMNLGILFIFKYLNFAISNIDKLFNDLIPQTDIVLPIGISFFTFQAMSYIIDVYRGDAKAQHNPFYLGLYISLFPQLIAGPIVRYNDIEAQIHERKVTADGFSEGVRRFVIGLAKKVVISNNLAIVADWAFLSYTDGTMSVIGAWTGAIAYILQIYFDFSGYSDMAIGLGAMMGFKFKENFNYPFVSTSITEFWRRWHISLGTWLKDYLYIPLGGSRVPKMRHYFNIFVLMACVGIWHGANWNYFIWGILFGIAMIIEKIFLLDWMKNPVIHALGHVYAPMFVVFNTIIFRGLGASATLGYMGCMFGATSNPIINDSAIFYLHEYWIFIVIAIVYATSVFKYLADKIWANEKTEKAFNVFSNVAYISIFLITLSFLVMSENNPFIYFNF